MIVGITLLLLSILAFYHSKSSRRKKTERVKNNDRKTKEIRFNGRFYDVTEWIEKHPGGKIIEFYVNNEEDSTIPIQQFHTRSEKKVQAILGSLKSRPIEVDSDEKDRREKNISEDFEKLFQELKAEGLFEPSLTYVGVRILELIFWACCGVYFIRSESLLANGVGVIFLFFCQFRGSFFMHEGGHHSLTGRPNWDRNIETFVMGLVNGYSGGWWRSTHNRHHAMPQRLNRDVDLETLPLVAYHSIIMKGNYNIYNMFLRHQSKVFVLLTWLARISWNVHIMPQHAWMRKNYFEMLLILLHYVGVYQIGVLPYLLVIMLQSPYMAITFAMSHSHTPVTVEPKHWVEYSSTHTINVHPSWWTDYFMGYLNLQIEHHLFPTLPQFRLRRINGRVKELVEKHGLPYTCVSYGEAFRMVFGNLLSVSKEIQVEAAKIGQKPCWLFEGF